MEYPDPNPRFITLAMEMVARGDPSLAQNNESMITTHPSSKHQLTPKHTLSNIHTHTHTHTHFKNTCTKTGVSGCCHILFNQHTLAAFFSWRIPNVNWPNWAVACSVSYPFLFSMEV